MLNGGPGVSHLRSIRHDGLKRFYECAGVHSWCKSLSLSLWPRTPRSLVIPGPLPVTFPSDASLAVKNCSLCSLLVRNHWPPARRDVVVPDIPEYQPRATWVAHL